MKKPYSLILITAAASLAMILGGCGVETVGPPPPTQIIGTPTTVQVVLSASAIASGGTTNVTVTVTDSAGRVVPNVGVAFTVISASSGSFSPAADVTNASGQTTTVFTAGAAVNANATIRATVTLSTGSVIGSAPITIGTPLPVPNSVVVALGAASILNGGSTTVTATVRDASSVLISGATVTFTVSPSGAGNFSPSATATTDAAGQATVTFNAVSSDTTVNITATAGTVNNSALLTIGTPPPPVAATMNLVASPTQITILGQSTINVSLLSSTSAPVFSTSVVITITAGPTLGSLSSSAAVTTVNATTDASGNASAVFYAYDTGGVVSITATSGSLSKTVAIVITSNPASISLTITDPIRLNGERTTITALVLNAANNPVNVGTQVTFTMTYNGTVAPGTLSSTTANTIGTGEASVTFTADTVVTGPVFITATAGTLTTPIQVIQVNPAGVGSLLFVSADPAIIGISGSGTGDTSIVTFQVLNSVGGPLANQAVNFSLAIGPVGATITTTGSTGVDGMVSTTLRSGTVAGPVRIVATTTVSPGPPAVTLSTSSGNMSIGGGVPSDKWLSVSASKLNIPGLGCDGAETTINAMLADRFGNYNILTGTSVSFAAEGGAVNSSSVTNNQGIASVVFRSQAPRPLNGRVSVLVMTTGEEDFFDANANGVFDDATFTSIPEPFIDSNENGGRDAGELFFDWPSTVSGSVAGSYNLANGVWDARIPIFRNITIVMSGLPVPGLALSRVETSTGGTGDIDIGNGGSQVFSVYVSDVNGNPPISGTTVNIKASKGSLSTSSVTIPDTNQSLPYAFNVRLTSPSCSSAPCAIETVTLDVTVDYSDSSFPGGCYGTSTTSFFYPGRIRYTYL